MADRGSSSLGVLDVVEGGRSGPLTRTREDGDGVTLVTTDRATYLVTSYNDYQGTSQAVEAALNTHSGMAAGLRDAVNRMASIDPGS